MIYDILHKITLHIFVWNFLDVILIAYLYFFSANNLLFFTWQRMPDPIIIRIIMYWSRANFDCWNGHNPTACKRILLILKYSASRQIIVVLHSEHMWLQKRTTHILSSFFIDWLNILWCNWGFKQIFLFWYNLQWIIMC
jgi:hypothetical protein